MSRAWVMIQEELDEDSIAQWLVDKRMRDDEPILEGDPEVFLLEMARMTRERKAEMANLLAEQAKERRRIMAESFAANSSVEKAEGPEMVSVHEITEIGAGSHLLLIDGLGRYWVYGVSTKEYDLLEVPRKGSWR